MLVNEIKKEELQSVVFSKVDVLKHQEDKNQRAEKLNSALLLDNLGKQKSKIVFKHSKGFGFVYTTIWCVSDFHIQLKAGVLMPISTILEVIF